MAHYSEHNVDISPTRSHLSLVTILLCLSQPYIAFTLQMLLCEQWSILRHCFKGERLIYNYRMGQHCVEAVGNAVFVFGEMGS